MKSLLGAGGGVRGRLDLQVLKWEIAWLEQREQGSGLTAKWMRRA